MPPTQSPILVGMADIQVARGLETLGCLGLGSCIGLCLYDQDARVGGLVHVMLPAAHPGKPVDKRGKFADTGVPELISMMERMGARKSRLLAAYAGGAQVFNFGDSNSRLDIGVRNAAAVDAQLRGFGIRVVSRDVGGNYGRTIMFSLETRRIVVRTVSQGEKLLCTLGV